MWILSQDDNLINLEKVIAIYHKANSDIDGKFAIRCVLPDSNNAKLASYETKEKTEQIFNNFVDVIRKGITINLISFRDE